LSKYLIAIFLCVFATLCQAAERIELFDVTVQVESQDETERDRAFSDAMLKVLGRVTGLDASEIQGVLPTLLSSAGEYVLGFSYRENSAYRASDNQIAVTSPEQQRKQMAKALGLQVSEDEQPFILSVQFSEAAVLARVRKAKLPVWGSLRPSILSWVVVQRDSRRQLISADTPELEQTFLTSTSDSGLVVFLPVADLKDQSLVNLNQLWGLFPESVAQASGRYPHDARLLVRVFEAAESLEAKWSLIQGRTEVGGRVSAGDYKALWQLLGSSLANHLALRYSITNYGGDVSVVRLSIASVSQFSDYVYVSDHLKALSSVASIQVAEITSSEIVLDVRLQGELTSFEQQLDLAGLLRPRLSSVNVAVTQGDTDGLNMTEPLEAEASPYKMLYYRWSPSKEQVR